MKKGWRVPWRVFLFEMSGMALLLLGGLSLVIFMFGSGNPVEPVIPSVVVRQSLSGFLFGCVGASIAVSTIGKESGAHINPAVTLGFWLMQKIDNKTAVGYVVSQLVGATLGCLPLFLWGTMGRSIHFGATLPGAAYTSETVVMGETITTFALISTLFLFLGIRSLRSFTPFIIPFLYAVMVPLEASISGTSTNPARTFGPAIISEQWTGWWIYWIGPFLGTLAAILICSSMKRRIEVAKLYYFKDDRRRFFHRMANRGLRGWKSA